MFAVQHLTEITGSIRLAIIGHVLNNLGAAAGAMLVSPGEKSKSADGTVMVGALLALAAVGALLSRRAACDQTGGTSEEPRV